MLRVDKAIEEIGLDVAELGNVSEEFLEAVREDIKLKSDKKYLYALPEVHQEDENEKEAKTDLYENDNEDDHFVPKLKGEAYIF